MDWLPNTEDNPRALDGSAKAKTRPKSGGALTASIAAVLHVACTSNESHVQSTPPAGDAAPAAAEAGAQRTITLTLFPFWERPIDADGVGPAVPLDGVEVCVKSARPYRTTDVGSLADFREVTGVCVTTAGREEVVLRGVPAMSELLLTASKDGYRSRLYPVTTWRWNQDARSLDVAQMNLSRSEQWQLLNPPTDPKAGSIDVFLLLLCAVDGGSSCSSLEGARVSLGSPQPAGSGPYYFRGPKILPSATETGPGFAAAAFFDLAESEYPVIVEHPNALCQVGDFGENTLYGYSSAILNQFYVPVLGGHSTSAVATCHCLPGFGGDNCARMSDAGSL